MSQLRASRATSCCCSPPVLPLLESKHLGFIHIPKNAGTSVEHALGLPRSCHATAAECSQCAPREWRRAVTFATVREPLARLVSLFEYTSRQYRQPREAHRRHALTADRPSFSVFVSRLYAHHRNGSVPGFFKAQHLYLCGRDGALVDAVLRVERLADEWDALRRERRGRSLPRLPSRQYRKIGEQEEDVASYYRDAETLRMAREVYADDFRLLVTLPPGPASLVCVPPLSPPPPPPPSAASPPPPPSAASPPPPPKRRRCVKPGFMWQRDGNAWKCARYTADVADMVKREKRREHRQHRANRQRQRKRDERKRQREADAEASADIAALGEDFGIF